MRIAKDARLKMKKLEYGRTSWSPAAERLGLRRARAALIAGLAAMPLLIPTVGHGFTSADDFTTRYEMLGRMCDVRLESNSNGYTRVSILLFGGFYSAGGSYYYGNGSVGSSPIYTQ